MTIPRVDLELAGKLLDGRYQVASLLGRGGMGSAWLATDTRADRSVVVKVPSAILLADPDFQERFERETRSLLSLDHPGIVKAYDLGRYENVPYLVLQYLSGGTLSERLEDRVERSEPWEIQEWLPRVARALDYIHEKSFIHRDVKPGNILFDEMGHAFLADFGIAKAVGQLDMTLTRTGVSMGSPEYMAPEAGMPGDLTGKYDQYSLSVVVYRALTGELPHHGTTPLQLAIKKVQCFYIES